MKVIVQFFMNFHMDRSLTSFADKFVGMHLLSVSKFGGKVKAQNGTIKPSNALRGHYRLVSYFCGEVKGIPITPSVITNLSNLIA